MTLLTRPRRFGKILNMSMLEKFFSVNYAGRSDWFQGLSIWEEKDSDGDYKYRKLQGIYPVLFISFAGIKEESIFSDLNYLEVVTTTSSKYADCFGFTEEEVFTALEEFGLYDQRKQVKDWYDGFTFGEKSDIYNPWSIINFLDKKAVGAYWANSSSNSLVEKLIQEGSRNVKETFETLLQGEAFMQK